MKILIVGNVFKDVYLNLDDRTETFETDGDGVKWLNLSFDASEHRFFRRAGSLGGAAITLEVLNKMGIESQISGSSVRYSEDGIEAGDTAADLYRYILVSDEQTTYFAPSYEHPSRFEVPSEDVDCIFVDRSANIEDASAILDYLEFSPATKLVVYARKNPRSKAEKALLERANLVFTERELPPVSRQEVVRIDHNHVTYRRVAMNFETPREELMTHLSIYSILAATILGGIILGKNADEVLKLAKTNVENSSLDACLDLDTLLELSA